MTGTNRDCTGPLNVTVRPLGTLTIVNETLVGVTADRIRTG